MISSSLFVVIILMCEYGNSTRILGLVPTPSYSHQAVFRPIWRELAKRGHDLVVITTDPENDPKLNIREIDISYAYDLWKKYDIVKQFTELRSNPMKINIVLNALQDICIQELLHPDIQALLKNDTEYFDLIIMEYMYPIMFGFPGRFKSPYIGVVTMDLTSFVHSMLGNPTHPVLYPDAILPYEGKLSFWERLTSSLFSIFYPVFSIISGAMDTGGNQQIMEDHFGIDLPPVINILKNVSMVFINVDPSSYTRPLGPAFVAIGGGTHLRARKALPKDLQEYLDSAANGVIYFSLGTNVNSGMVPPDMRKVMIDTFKELPYKVLWKFDITIISDLPENVKIVEWLPQQDILRHPNIKVFITQGGLQSMEEAIFSNVPVVGIPFLTDQDGNVKKMARRGFGVYLDKEKLTRESFKEAILEVINNPRYRKKTIEIAELSRDQPMTGLEKAVWWAEYVVRHKGAPHFKSPSIDLPLYQYYLLDVIGFILSILLVLIYASFKTIVFIKKIILLIFKKKVKYQ